MLANFGIGAPDRRLWRKPDCDRDESVFAECAYLSPDQYKHECGAAGKPSGVPASAHFPKFVLHRSTHRHELRKVMGYSQTY